MMLKQIPYSGIIYSVECRPLVRDDTGADTKKGSVV